MATIRGNSRGNTLNGTADGDVLYGLGGADRLRGGDGADVLYGDDNALGASFGFGNDRLDGGAGKDVLVGGAGADRLSGGDGDDVLIGGFATNVSNDGQSTGYSFGVGVDGGNDSYDGGSGFDIALLTFDRAAGIVLDISSPRVSAITADGAQIGSIRGVEAVAAFMGAGDDAVTGGAWGDELHGRDGDDILSGGGGSDHIDGGAGNDRLSGGDGFDTLSYADAPGGVRVSLALAGQAQDTLGAGTDTITGFEQIDGSNYSDVLTGSAGNDFMTAGNGGNDRLLGGDGDDGLTIYRFASDTPTVSTLSGGDGNDVLTVSAAPGATDQVTVLGGAGDDSAYLTVSARQTVAMGAGEDRVVLTLGLGEVGITLGRGVDTVAFSDVGGTPASQTAAHVRDFATGNNGDRIDLHDLVAHATAGDPGSNPFADGFVRLVASDSGTALQVDWDGATGEGGFVTVLELDGTASQDFNAFNFGGTDPHPTGAADLRVADAHWPALACLA